MKKQILACAVAAAFTASAFAADVTVYGGVDTGLKYSRVKAGSAEATNSFTMESGMSAASRWGIKGSEELGNGYTVSFDLQSGFNSDDGTLGQNGRLFGREARLTVAGPFGELSFGRMGSFTSSAGTYDIFMGTADVYDGGWTSAIGGSNFFYDVGRCDNMVTYATPSMAGFKGYAQYSFKVDSTDETGTEGRNSSKRYAGVGVTYENGPFAAVAVFDTVMNPTADAVAKKDSRKFSVGASYDFDVAKVFVAYQYAKNENTAAGIETVHAVYKYAGRTPVAYDSNQQLKGHNFHVGVSAPVCSGTFSLGGYYTTVEGVENSNLTIKSFDVAATYTYPFSKRTYVYAGVGYMETKSKFCNFDGESVKTKTFDAAVGLHHNF